MENRNKKKLNLSFPMEKPMQFFKLPFKVYVESRLISSY